MSENIDYGERLRKLGEETGLVFPPPPSREVCERIIRNCQPPYEEPGTATSEEILAAGERFCRATAPALAEAVSMLNGDRPYEAQ